MNHKNPQNIPYEKVRNYHIRLKIFMILVFAHFSMQSFAITHTSQPLDVYGKMSVEDLLSEGLRLYREGDPQEAIKALTVITMSEPESMNPEEKQILGKAYKNLGAMYLIRKNYTKSFEMLQNALLFLSEEDQAGVHVNIAAVYEHYQNREAMRIALDKGMKLAAKGKDARTMLNAALNIMLVDSFVDIYDDIAPQAIEVANFVINHPVDSLPQEYSVIQDLAKAYVDMSDNKGEDARKLIGSLPDRVADKTRTGKWISMLSKMFLAKSLILEGNDSKALELLIEAEEEADSKNASEVKMPIFKSILSILDRTPGDSRYHKYRLKFLEYKDSTINIGEYDKIADLQFEREISNLKKGMAIEEARHKAKKIIISIMGACLLGFVFVVIVIVRQNRKIRHDNKLLFEKNLKLLELSAPEHIQSILQSTNATTLDESSIEEPENEESSANHREDADNVTDETTDCDKGLSVIRSRILNIMDQAEVICDSNFSLDTLASLAESNKHTVSEAINKEIGMNFNALLNSYRIREAMKRLLDTERYGHLTNEAIAHQLGYASRSHFSQTFKSIVGLTPTEYKRQGKSHQSQNTQK